MRTTPQALGIALVGCQHRGEPGAAFTILEQVCDECTQRELKSQDDYWNKLVEQKDNERYVRVDGHHYAISPDNSSPNTMRGFGGRRFNILFKDGRKVVSHNLWAQGSIPLRFRERLPDNAFFVDDDADKKRVLDLVDA